MKIKLDPDLNNKIVHLPEIETAALAIAEKIADAARANAPVDSGRYSAGISVQKTKTGARVFASDQKSAWIEFGIPSQGKPAQFILRKAAQASGFKFKKRR